MKQSSYIHSKDIFDMCDFFLNVVALAYKLHVISAKQTELSDLDCSWCIANLLSFSDDELLL